MVSKYLVTGANGFIALHIIDQLLRQGEYVRGTVRNLSDEARLASLKQLGPIELVEANLLDDASIRNALKGIDIVLHVASPASNIFTLPEEDVIKQAVQGIFYLNLNSFLN